MEVENVIAGVLVASAIAGTCGLSYLVVQEGNKWSEFKTEHNCKVVARIDGDVMNTFGVSSSGKPVIGITSTPNKTGWLCDDGITYYR